MLQVAGQETPCFHGPTMLTTVLRNRVPRGPHQAKQVHARHQYYEPGFPSCCPKESKRYTAGISLPWHVVWAWVWKASSEVEPSKESTISLTSKDCITAYTYIYIIYIIFVYAYIHGHMVERCWKHPTKFSFWHGLWCFCRCLDILFLALTVGPNFGLPKMVLFQNLDRGTSFRFRAPQTNGRFIHSKQKMRSFAEVSKKCSETKC